MSEIVAADGPFLEQILDTSYDLWSEGLTRAAYWRFWEAQLRTAWGQTHLRRFALVEGRQVLASAKRYDLTAVMDGRTVPAFGLGAIFTPPALRGRGWARTLVERLLAEAAREGIPLALLFSEIGPDYYLRLGFQTIPTSDLVLHVAHKPGAPAMTVRGGDDRDLPAIAAMGKIRAEGRRFHLDRDVDLIQYAVAKKRLLAGLAPGGTRGLQFFIADEGITAAAYLVVSVHGGVWTIEECGDRDPSGARVGAMLQVLLAREPAERRPVVRGWLPAGFLPPQVTIGERRPSAQVMMIRPLGSLVAPVPPLGGEDVLWWHGDVF